MTWVKPWPARMPRKSYVVKEISKRASIESTATPGRAGSYHQLDINGYCHEAVLLMSVQVS